MKKLKPGQKRCPKCEALVSGPRTKMCPKCGHAFNGKPVKAPVPEVAPVAVVAVEKPTKPVAVVSPQAPAVVKEPAKDGNTITLEQIKKVAETVKMLGGFQRATEMLEVIRELGGVKKFKELAEAITVSETSETKI
jgi:hypothetical protein